MVRSVRILWANLLVALFSLAQEPPPEPPKADLPVYFSGTVMQFSLTSLTVNRKGMGSNAATKTFVIDGETKVEGKVRVKVKVTVRFVMDEEGHPKAVHIIVR
jgi:hypothetical protein